MIAPARIQDDLRGLFRGRLQFDAVTTAVYAQDASPFALTPLGVAEPLDAADLTVLIEYAYQHSIPLVPRGAGTSLAGAALGAGVVVDLAAQFRTVEAIGPDWVRVQAGVTIENLGQALAPHGRRFPVLGAGPTPRTLGGLIATDAAGSNAHRAGYSRDHTLALGVVFDTGETATVLGPSCSPEKIGLPGPPERGPRFVELRAQTAALLAEHRDLIQLARPQTRFDRCGYNLAAGLAPGGLDLVRVLVGSEGTLALFTDLTLATEPVPGGVADVVIGFMTLDAALQAALTFRSVDGVAACDLLDQRHLARARPVPPGEGIGSIPAAVGAALIVTVEASSPEGAAARLRHAAATACRGGTGAVLAGPASTDAERARVARFLRAAIGPLVAPTRGPRPLAGVEDVAVPVEELPRFLPQLRAICQRFDVAAAVRVRVLAGMVHAQPLLDLADPADRAKFWPLAEAIHHRAIAVGGTVSTAHGTGLARTPWVERQYGPLTDVFRELKRVYDPKGVLNPGRGTDPDPSRPAWPLRPQDSVSPRVPLLTWTAPELAAQVANCTGCGDCRTHEFSRMCPVFRATNQEAASPRAKVVLFRAALSDSASVRLDDEDARAVAATCVHCKMCPRDCSARVEVPRLALEIKAATFAENGLDRTDWVLARIESLVWLLSKAAFTANVMLRLRPTRWLIEKLFGISRRRSLPRLTHRTFLIRAWRQGLSRRPAPLPVGDPVPPRPRVAYFVDHFANYHDTSIASATVAVLKHNGVDVHVPWRQRACGLAPLVQGDLETAREIATYNIRTLASLVRDGHTIVCSEPTAAVTITQDYLTLLDTPDARLVAANTVELTHYLLDLHHRQGLRTDFQRLDVNLGHHVPCHVKALGRAPAAPELLGLIPGVQAYPIDAGCSGMAGPYGLRADSIEASRAAGAALFAELAHPRVIYGSTECGPCRLQMQDGSGKRTLHPVQYLALAYGLQPELRTRLGRPVGRRLD